MSYYQGDYYRGDPGFFSFLGGLAKKAVGFIPGVGPIASSALSMIPSGGSKLQKISTAARAMTKTAGAIIVKHPVLSGAAAAGVVGAGASMASRRMGGVSGRAAMGGMRRHRRMRVTNPKALRRALRRAQGFEKLARRVLHVTSAKRVKVHGFKRVGRKKR
jgi:hypothetical protein